MLAFLHRSAALGVAMLGVVMLNAVFAFFRERHAEHAVEALALYLPVRASVVRDGRRSEVDAAGLVRGDFLVIAEGDRISADGRHPHRGSHPARVLAEHRFFTNPVLLWAIGADVVLTAAIVYVPPLQSVFDTTALPLWQVALVLPFPFLVWGADEVRRWNARRQGRPTP